MGTLISHVRQTTVIGSHPIASAQLGTKNYNVGDYVRVTEYHVTAGVDSCATTCVVDRITEQVSLPPSVLAGQVSGPAPSGFDIFTFAINADGSKGKLTSYQRQLSTGDGITPPIVFNYEVNSSGNVVLASVCDPDEPDICELVPHAL